MLFMKHLDILSVIVYLGFFSMGFQLVGSRLLAPHFGSSIIVWAFLISTFLAAFSTGALFGGWVSGLSSRRRRIHVWSIACLQTGALMFTALLGKSFLRIIEASFESLAMGLFISCLALFFLPIMMLSAFPPLSTQVLASRGLSAGLASGLIYGLSTIGNIAGVMGTTFLLIPNFRISQLLIMWVIFVAPSLVYLTRKILSGGN